MSKLHFLFIFYIFSVLFKMYQVITGKFSNQKLGTLSVHFGTILGTFGKITYTLKEFKFILLFRDFFIIPSVVENFLTVDVINV